MKTPHLQIRFHAVFAGLAFVASIGRSWAVSETLTTSWTNNFDTGGSTTNFPIPGWYYWYGAPGGNTPMTNDVSLDVHNNPNSGCLMVVSPFDTNANLNVFYYLFTSPGPIGQITADLTYFDSISFYIRMAPGTPPRQVNGTNVDFGTISAGFYYPYTAQFEGTPTIPLAASNSWVLLTVPIYHPVSGPTIVDGIAFGISSYGNGYPQFVMTNYIDGLQLNAIPPPHPSLSPPFAAIAGFNAIAATGGENGEYYRYQIVTAADTGHTFVGQPGATYSWTIKSFPTGTGEDFQQHFFIVNGGVVPFDNTLDYYQPDVFWITVQQSDAGVAFMDFRLKTNEPDGNGMLFNTNSPTDTTNNPNGWPVEPIATLSDPNGAVGTWSVTVANNTNITLHSPTGLMTSFSISATQAAFFADPCTLILGGQPNDPNSGGKAVVYSSFSAAGVASPFTDNFLADTSFNTNLWNTMTANDTNGVVLVPANAVWWVSWALPDAGFVLQTKGSLNAVDGWTQPNCLEILDNGRRQALVLSSQLADPAQGYFQLIQYHASMLQVLFDGQANAPYTTLGYTGSPTPISGASGPDGAVANVTINAVDSTFHIDPTLNDVVTLTSTADPNTVEPLNAALANGTLTEQVLFLVPGNFTVTATDVTNPAITAGTSASLTLNP